MVNVLRKFSQPILITVTVLVIITFAWWGPSRFDRAGHADAAAIVDGKPVSVEEWKRQARMLQVHQQLGDDYASAMDPSGRFRGGVSMNAVGNALVFDRQADALGVSATQKELEEQLGRTPGFMGRDGKFDASRFEGFVQQVLNPEGFNRSAIDGILRDAVRAQKVSSVLAGTMPPTPTEIRNQFLKQRLTTEASYVTVPAGDLKAAQKVTEDEIKKRYEVKKDFLKSPEKRKVRYAAFTLPPTPDGKPMEESKKTEELQKLANKAYDLAAELQKPGVNFDEAAKAAGATVGETAEYFSQDAGPKELEDSAKAAQVAFALSKEKPYSQHIPLEKGTYVLAFKDAKPPEQLTLDNVRKQLEDELISEKADTAMREKANEVRTKLVEAKKAGKSFYDAAQSLGLKAEPFPSFSMMKPAPPGTPNADVVQPAAAKLAPGDVSEVIATPDKALIVHVDQRPVVDEKGIEEARAEITSRIQATREAMALQAFLADRKEETGFKGPQER